MKKRLKVLKYQNLFVYHRHHFLVMLIKWSMVAEFGLSIGSPRALLHTPAEATPKHLETPNKTV
jgi:hypothetical protein